MILYQFLFSLHKRHKNPFTQFWLKNYWPKATKWYSKPSCEICFVCLMKPKTETTYTQLSYSISLISLWIQCDRLKNILLGETAIYLHNIPHLVPHYAERNIKRRLRDHLRSKSKTTLVWVSACFWGAKKTRSLEATTCSELMGISVRPMHIFPYALVNVPGSTLNNWESRMRLLFIPIFCLAAWRQGGDLLRLHKISYVCC